MRAMRTLLAALAVAALAACGGAPKKVDDGPRPDDVPQEVTCCIAVDGDGNPTHEIVPVARCAEANRNPVDACDIGPGDAEPDR